MLAENPARTTSDLEWHIGTGRWEALCVCELAGDDFQTRASVFLRVLAGNWQVVYEHRG
jgi:hypothetical protein